MTDSNRSRTVVIVEQDPVVRQMFADTLGPKGYVVAEAASSEEFFRSASHTNSTTDIFVEDAAIFFISLDLYGNQGLKIVEWLQSCERWADVPVTVLASDETFSQVLPASYYGAHGYLVKGFDAKGLCRHVASALKAQQPTFESGLPVISFSLSDYLAREISRAKRTSTPVSIMMGSFVGQNNPVAEISATVFENDLPWVEEALEICRLSIRECDTVLQVGLFTFIAVLPLTDKKGVSVIETRLHDSLRPLLRGVKNTLGQEFSLITSSACAPEEAEDWRTFIDLARVRLRVAVEERMSAADNIAA